MTTVWRIDAGPVDQWAMLVVPEDCRKTDYAKNFFTNGHLLEWPERMRLDRLAEKRRKHVPHSDVIPFISASLVLNTKAYQALGPFLAQFGQLLELDVDNEPGYYFYNVTNLVPCIDRAQSEMYTSTTIRNEAFFDDAIPIAPAIFKDMLMPARFYTNDAGKKIIEDIIKSHNITGLMFCRAGIDPVETAARQALETAQAAEAYMQIAGSGRKPSGKMTSALFAIEAERLRPLIKNPEELAEPMTAHGKNGLGVRDFLDLDETWQVIHFLLTGTDFDTEGPLGRATMGGREIGNTQIGCGTAKQVMATAKALARITPEQLAWRFRPIALIEEQIYPDRWEGEGAMGIRDILPYYEKLRAFYAAAAARGDAVLSIVP